MILERRELDISVAHTGLLAGVTTIRTLTDGDRSLPSEFGGIETSISWLHSERHLLFFFFISGIRTECCIKHTHLRSLARLHVRLLLGIYFVYKIELVYRGPAYGSSHCGKFERGGYQLRLDYGMH